MAGADGRGVLFAVVGPSGAGKDSVIGHARRAFAGDGRVLFVRRVISRPADAGGEDHDGVTEAEFRRRDGEGAFCVTWRAHGLHYGLPASVLAHVEAGGIAVANGSRKALDRIADRFARVRVVEITAAPDVIARRLAARGRESGAEITARLNRSVPVCRGTAEAVTLDNGGPLDVAGEAFVDLVRRELDVRSAACSPACSPLTKSG